MDISTIITSGASFALGIGTVYAFIKKYYMPVKEVGDIILTIYKSIDDGKLTKEEVDTIIDECNQLKATLITLKSKK